MEYLKMDKQLLGSIVFGIMGTIIGIGVIITGYNNSITLVPLDSSMAVCLIAMTILLGFSIAMLNNYVRGVGL